ncbi:UPF0711 protein C18orf21 homolog [Acropora muricata]|uniref:UPF0711 protein C18orf21 homolog n=1 Tax=Acropora muricata TaxID=159855 RepID=UPI0034E44AC2
MAASDEIEESLQRDEHLWQLATQCFEQNPTLSRFYVSKISESTTSHLSANNLRQYCPHCFERFRGGNCRVRLLAKRRKAKKRGKTKNNNSKAEKNSTKNNEECLRLPRKFNHLSVFCKKCRKHSFHTGQRRSEKTSCKKGSISKAAKLELSTPLNTNMEHRDKSSQSTTKRQRRRNLMRMLLDEEKKKATSLTTSPRQSLQAFLSSL